MGTKIGDAVALRLNGTSYAIPKGVEPIVYKGGKKITETQDYGDGTSDGFVSIQPGKITGLKIKLSDENKDTYEKDSGLSSMPIILECVSRSFELTGFIVGEGGSSATKSVTEDFEVKATDGSGVRES